MRRNSALKFSLAVLATLTLFGCSGGGGSSCTSNAECSETEFCKLEIGTCGTSSASGSCQELPQTCTNEQVPVCSCEKLTFFNECWADAAGQSIQAKGECP
ncbi:MAG: hypothetical protein GYA55_10600 [SAR324 cluster bacterium]|uniref:Kazal-like domain-containing protein n=1 Tax=SAR324 cluster bacterium TaxID=2024889 RepID=A0A7X9IM28_9DELT|nr:hypothetical protein [SAR324 cluster bacterium]